METNVVIEPRRTAFSFTERNGELHHRQRTTSSTTQFLQESYTSSVDFPAYIPWQTLSSDLSEKLRHGSVRINRSNCVEWASTIKEENERSPLLDQLARKYANGSIGEAHSSSSSGSDITKPGVTDAVRGDASWGVGVFLLVNAALGAGVLNYPVAYDKMGGIAVATIVQTIVIIMLCITMYTLVYCSDLKNVNTYHDVIYSMCGKKSQQLSATSIMLTCFGICVTFLVIIGDQYDRIFATLLSKEFCGGTWYLDRHFTISLTAIATILPMCYFKRLDFLRYASTLGIFAMFYVVFLTVYEYFMLGLKPTDIKSSPDSFVNLIAVLPVVCVAYQTHEVIVPIYACMRERKLTVFSKAGAVAMILLFFLYCTTGTFGYITYGSTVAADIMQMYDARDPVVAIGIVALVIKMITTYPPIMFCGRGAMDGLYAEFRKLTAEEFIQGEKQRRIVITTIWFITTLLLSVVTPNITVAMELLGSLASCNVFLFPGMCIISLAYRNHPRFRTLYSKMLFICGLFIMLTGVFFFFLMIYQGTRDLIYGSEDLDQFLCG